MNDLGSLCWEVRDLKQPLRFFFFMRPLSITASAYRVATTQAW